MVKTFQSLAKPYIGLAQAFERGDMKRLEAEVDAARDIWRLVSDDVLSLYTSLFRVLLELIAFKRTTTRALFGR